MAHYERSKRYYRRYSRPKKTLWLTLVWGGSGSYPTIYNSNGDMVPVVASSSDAGNFVEHSPIGLTNKVMVVRVVGQVHLTQQDEGILTLGPAEQPYFRMNLATVDTTDVDQRTRHHLRYSDMTAVLGALRTANFKAGLAGSQVRFSLNILLEVT